MRLILGILLAAVPVLAWSMMQQQQDQQSGGGDSTDNLPDTLPDKSFVEAIGFMSGNQTRGERNNNPGNIVKSAINWQGQVQGNDSRFVTFDSPESGIRALAILLRNYQAKYGLNTVTKIIQRYAPPSENNTPAYIRSVAAAVGVGPDQPINLADTQILGRMVQAIIQHENGRNIYATSTIASGVSLA